MALNQEYRVLLLLYLEDQFQWAHQMQLRMSDDYCVQGMSLDLLIVGKMSVYLNVYQNLLSFLAHLDYLEHHYFVLSSFPAIL
jgi:hypothetical protein